MYRTENVKDRLDYLYVIYNDEFASLGEDSDQELKKELFLKN